MLRSTFTRTPPTVTLTVDVGDEERVLLMPRHENAYASVGTVAQVVEKVRLPGGARLMAGDAPPGMPFDGVKGVMLALQYDTVAEADAAANVVLDWTANTTSVNATGLSSSTTYAFAVLVKDQAGNKSLYTPKSTTTSASSGNRTGFTDNSPQSMRSA